MSKKDKWILAITLVLALTASAWQYTRSHRLESRSPWLPAYSTHSANPEGAKAGFLVAGELGLEPRRWGASLLQLRDLRAALVIAPEWFSPFTSRPPIMDEEIAALLTWVKSGNAAMVLGETATKVTDAGSKDIPPTIVSIDELHGAKIGPISKAFDTIPKGYEAVAQAKQGAVIIKRNLGKGVIYGVSDASLLSNAELLDEQNVQLLSLVAFQDRPLYFDEYHLGFESPQSAFDILPPPVKTSFFLLCGIAVLFVLKLGSRFGQVDEGPPPSIRSSAELAYALGALMNKARASEVAQRELVARFRKDVGLDPNLPLESAVAGIVDEDDDLCLELKTLPSADIVNAMQILERATQTIRAAKRGRIRN